LPQTRFRRGFTWIELIAILVFLAIVLGILIPAVQYARERSRREACMNNLKQIGLGMLNYEDARHYFPPAADLRGEGNVKAAGGWSFFLRILPNMEYNDVSRILNPNDLKSKTIDPLMDNGTAGAIGSGLNCVAYFRDTSFEELVCPANPNQLFASPNTPPTQFGKKIAFTNYKALGATSMDSLLVGIDPDNPPPYGDRSQHPDGVLFPAASGLKIDDIKDGLACTIMIVETMDDSKSAWIAGCDVNLVGMNKAATYSQFQDKNASYWAPSGFNGNFYSEAASTIQSQRTFLAFNFRPGHKDAGTYPAGVGRTPAYGPSSPHPGVVNHLFCDGSVHSLRTDIDYAAYFFAITRDNGGQEPVSSNE
jgi:type II secretory pathway pseudopilin PulG